VLLLLDPKPRVAALQVAQVRQQQRAGGGCGRMREVQRQAGSSSMWIDSNTSSASCSALHKRRIAA
jgi:hypothetical protein